MDTAFLQSFQRLSTYDFGTKKANLTNHSSNVFFLRNQSNIDFVNLRTLKVFRETKIKTMNLAMDK